MDPDVVAKDDEWAWCFFLELLKEVLDMFSGESFSLRHMSADKPSFVAYGTNNRHVLKLGEAPRLFEGLTDWSPCPILLGVWLENRLVNLNDLPSFPFRLPNLLLHILNHP